jgi:cupin fold WbuC family metalloprotein
LRKAEFITINTLDHISLQARQSPRLRKNYNFHEADDDPCHRLLNAMEPDSYIQPHRHLDPGKDETLIPIRGKMGLVIFDEQGKIVAQAVLEPQGDCIMANVPHGLFHTWLCLEAGSVFFESKSGPYKPLTSEEKAPWAPEETDASAGEYLMRLKKMLA